MVEEQRIIQQLARAVPWRRRRAVRRELNAHIAESTRDLELGGLPAKEAAQEAYRRLGDPDMIASAFSDTYRPSRRARVVLALGLAAGMLLGVYGLGGSFANAKSTHRSVQPSAINHKHAYRTRHVQSLRSSDVVVGNHCRH